MAQDSYDPWRQEVSQALGRIEANVSNLGVRRDDHETRIKSLETKQNKRDGILSLIVLAIPVIPFLPDIKKFFGV